MKKLLLVLVVPVLFLGLTVPASTHAQSIGIPCGIDENKDGVVSNYDRSGAPVPPGQEEECTFSDLVQLVRNIVDFLVVLSIPIAVIGFMYAGFLILTAGPNPGQISKGKGLLIKIGIGFFFVLAAWLIVYTITSALFGAEFSPFLR